MHDVACCFGELLQVACLWPLVASTRLAGEYTYNLCVPISNGCRKCSALCLIRQLSSASNLLAAYTCFCCCLFGILFAGAAQQAFEHTFKRSCSGTASPLHGEQLDNAGSWCRKLWVLAARYHHLIGTSSSALSANLLCAGQSGNVYPALTKQQVEAMKHRRLTSNCDAGQLANKQVDAHQTKQIMFCGSCNSEVGQRAWEYLSKRLKVG